MHIEVFHHSIWYIRLRKCKEYENNSSLLEVKIETGRTHQIRAHLAHIGYPIIGERVNQILTKWELKGCSHLPMVISLKRLHLNGNIQLRMRRGKHA